MQIDEELQPLQLEARLRGQLVVQQAAGRLRPDNAPGPTMMSLPSESRLRSPPGESRNTYVTAQKPACGCGPNGVPLTRK